MDQHICLDRIVVSTFRCGRKNLSSNLSGGNFFDFFFDFLIYFFKISPQGGATNPEPGSGCWLITKPGFIYKLNKYEIK